MVARLGYGRTAPPFDVSIDAEGLWGRASLKQRYWMAALALPGIAAAAQAAAKCEAGQVAQFPVTMVGLRPQVHAKINGKDAIFTADSGAWFSLISPGSAAEFGLKLRPLPEGFYLIGIGGSFVPKLTVVDNFIVAGVPVPRVEFLVGGSESGAVGLLGQNFLAIEDTEFDLANGVIKLMRSRNCGNTNMAYWAPPTASYSMVQTEALPADRRHIIAPVYVNGVKLRALFDTGSPMSFVSLRAAARFGLKPGAAGVMPAGSSGGLGRATVSTWIGPVASVKIGDEEIRNTRLRFGGDIADVDMLVGTDFFLSHHVYWSNANHRMFFTFNGGHVFDLRYLGGQDDVGELGGRAVAKSADAGGVAPLAPDSSRAPVDAEGFSRRGAARMVRGDTSNALADINQAIKLAPDNPDFLRQRAMLYGQTRQPLRALEDIDRLLKIKPDDIDALIIRAGIRLRLDRKSDVRSDLDSAAAAAPKSSDQRLTLAELYGVIEDYPQAIAQYDLWIAAHPDDSRRPTALNGRCWTRAIANVDLDRAVKDCNSAISAGARKPAFLDSRGLVRLRLGDYARAVADYDEALKAMPDIAWSHYGRGIAELRLGRKAEGEADIAKARALDGRLAEQAQKHGILP